MKQKGFTLIELLVVVSLIIVVVGVAGDIVVSLVRGYNKTQITNEVEQNANFTMAKLEKELQNAYEVTAIQSDSITFKREKSGVGGIVTTETISYTVESAGSDIYYIARAVDGAAPVAVTNFLVVTASASFADISASASPKVIKIILTMSQVGSALPQFTQSTTLESTVIVRGSY